MTHNRPPDSVSASSLSPLAVLRAYPAFRRLWFGAMASALGDVMTWVALLWYVLEVTNSGAAVGIVLICFAVPAALTSTPIGRFLDNYQPRTVMVWDNLARALVIGSLPLLHHLNLLTIPGVYVIAALSGALSPVTQVGVRIVVPATVPDNALVGANTALSLTQQIAVIFGNLLAGFIINRWGAPNALLFDAASMLLMAWALAGIPDISRETRHDAVGDAVAIGWQTLFAAPAVVVMTVISFVFFFAYGPTEAALPIHTKDALKADAQGFGYLWSALGVGSALGGLTANYLSARPRPGLTLAWIMFGWGVTQGALAVAPTLLLAAVAMFAGGVIWGPYMALETTLIQRLIPANRHGSVFGARTALLTPAMPLGTALGGFLLTLLSPRNVILLSALACVLAGLAALLSPGLRRIRQEETKS